MTGTTVKLVVGEVVVVVMGDVVSEEVTGENIVFNGIIGPSEGVVSIVVVIVSSVKACDESLLLLLLLLVVVN